MTTSCPWLLTLFSLLFYLPIFAIRGGPLISTESDPDAFVENSVNVINGDYCESATDFIISGAWDKKVTQLPFVIFKTKRSKKL